MENEEINKWELLAAIMPSGIDLKEISEDEHKANEANIEDLTKEFNTKIDNLVKAKAEEVMKI
jgi:ribosome recycling factor